MTDKIRIGAAAKRLLNDPVLRTALDGMKGDVIRRMEQTDGLDGGEMEELYRMLRTLKSFEHKLTNLINGGIKAESRKD